MNLLEPSEREVMKLRFVEQLQYHEIAAAQAIPIGTVQSRVFNAKKTISAAFSGDSDRLPRRWYESRRRPGSEFVGMARFLKLLPEHPLPNVRPAMK
jgi:hypothetical protein